MIGLTCTLRLIDQRNHQLIRSFLLFASQQYGRYNEYIKSGKSYVQGTVDDPQKLRWRSRMVTSLDKEYDEGKTVRQAWFDAYANDDQNAANEIAAFLSSEYGWDEIPSDYRDEYIDLLMSQMEAYKSLN